MKLNQIRIVLLGALNGLLIGVVLEGLWLIYSREQLNHELTEAASQNRGIGYILQPTTNVFLPLLCIVALAAASHFVHRYFTNQTHWLLMIWFLLGALSLMAGYYMATVPVFRDWSLVWLFAFVVISYFVYYGWIRHPTAAVLIWPVVGITALFVILAITQAIGLFRIQRNELRDPLVWLVCLALIIVINLIFGGVLSFLMRNHWSVES